MRLGYAAPAAPVKDTSKGKKLKEYLKSHSITQKDFISMHVLSDEYAKDMLEGKRDFNLATWVITGRMLQCTVDEIVGD